MKSSGTAGAPRLLRWPAIVQSMPSLSMIWLSPAVEGPTPPHTVQLHSCAACSLALLSGHHRPRPSPRPTHPTRTRDGRNPSPWTSGDPHLKTSAAVRGGRRTPPTY